MDVLIPCHDIIEIKFLMNMIKKLLLKILSVIIGLGYVIFTVTTVAVLYPVSIINKSMRICLKKLGLLAILTVMTMSFSSCETSHSFTINAESIENPSIHYADSIKVYNPINKK